jgi:hypothetical protein
VTGAWVGWQRRASSGLWNLGSALLARCPWHPLPEGCWKQTVGRERNSALQTQKIQVVPLTPRGIQTSGQEGSAPPFPPISSVHVTHTPFAICYQCLPSPPNPSSQSLSCTSDLRFARDGVGTHGHLDSNSTLHCRSQGLEPSIPAPLSHLV